MSSLANLRTFRLYRGSLALAEAESSSGRRPVALLEHLDRTDLKAGGFQASNVVRIHSRIADSLIVGWLCARFGNYTITILPSSVWLTWIGADSIRSAGHGWQWKIVRERALYSRPCGDGRSQGTVYTSWVSNNAGGFTTNHNKGLQHHVWRNPRKSLIHEHVMEFWSLMPMYMAMAAHISTGRTGGLTAKEAQRLLRIWDQAGWHSVERSDLT